MKLRRVFAISMILCFLLAVGGSPAAAEFPSRTMRIIVPFSAGGATDLMARILATAMASRLGDAEIIVENRPGGGGAIGMTELIQSPADGHTLILASTAAAMFTPIISDVGYCNEDIVPIAQVSTLPTNIFVPTDSEIQNLEDLMKRAEANFGRMTFATTGVGSPHHIVGELFQHAAGKPGLLTHVPFTSGPESIAALLGGHVDFAFANASYGESYVRQQGVLRVLVSSAPDGCPILPGIPSFVSLGYDVAFSSWWTLFAPAGTPETTLDLLDGIIKDAITDPQVIQQIENIGMLVAYVNRADFTYQYANQFKQMQEFLPGIF